jgi:hypothetical protein
LASTSLFPRLIDVRHFTFELKLRATGEAFEIRKGDIFWANLNISDLHCSGNKPLTHFNSEVSIRIISTIVIKR